MERGPQVVVITSLLLKENKSQNISILASNRDSVYIVTTPCIPITLNGTGDLTSALFTHFYLKCVKKLLENIYYSNLVSISVLIFE
jgi:pyridoxine kinase